jgi:hypothetical protein
MKFIIKFLVCVVLRNFQSDEILLPEVRGLERKTLVGKLIEENPFLAKALTIMRDQENEKLSREDRLRLLSLGIGKGFFDNEIEMIKGQESMDD